MEGFEEGRGSRPKHSTKNVDLLHALSGVHCTYMLITVAAQKGGVGKTTTAVHLAAVLNEYAPTMLIDEEGAGATQWASAGRLPFPVLLEHEAADRSSEYTHHVIDVGARANPDVLQRLAASSDYILLPSTADALALGALMPVVQALRELEAPYGVLLTMTAPAPSKDAEQAQVALQRLGVNVLRASIPRAVALQRAALAGVTVADTREVRAMPLWLAHVAVAKEIMRHVEARDR